jgi:hypothetical protein
LGEPEPGPSPSPEKQEQDRQEKEKVQEGDRQEAEAEAKQQGGVKAAEEQAKQEAAKAAEEQAKQEAAEAAAALTAAATTTIPATVPPVLRVCIADPTKANMAQLFSSDPQFGRYTGELASFISVLATKASAPVQCLQPADGTGLLLRLPLAGAGAGGLRLPTKHSGKISKLGTLKETDSFLPFDLQLHRWEVD